eukprot:TRINITY_DN996_c0_g1_i3.p2 TRINITY_DN996_c0_g1~~TRINITY_DN996_c0_g1_i3.p2  ORF type:complete len:109 (-),score=6.53 TRINITY_DN996_c0_g1_i3:21-347(-)
MSWALCASPNLGDRDASIRVKNNEATFVVAGSSIEHRLSSESSEHATICPLIATVDMGSTERDKARGSWLLATNGMVGKSPACMPRIAARRIMVEVPHVRFGAQKQCN